MGKILKDKEEYKADLERSYREGRGEMKIEIVKILEKCRLKPKEELSITEIQNEIRNL